MASLVRVASRQFRVTQVTSEIAFIDDSHNPIFRSYAHDMLIKTLGDGVPLVASRHRGDDWSASIQHGNCIRPLVGRIGDWERGTRKTHSNFAYGLATFQVDYWAASSQRLQYGQAEAFQQGREEKALCTSIEPGQFLVRDTWTNRYTIRQAMKGCQPIGRFLIMADYNQTSTRNARYGREGTLRVFVMPKIADIQEVVTVGSNPPTWFTNPEHFATAIPRNQDLDVWGIDPGKKLVPRGV
jgi:hypothetical protein